MSVSSLTKFTVPLASDQSATTQGLLMPKLSYRFRASFENFGVSTPRSELSKQVISISRPSVTFDPIDIDVYNSRVRLVGKPSWEDMTVSIRDDAQGSVTRLVGEQIQKQYDFMEQSSAASGIDYKFILRYEVLDGGNGANTPTILETWEVYGAFIGSANYSDTAYETNDPMTIELTLRFDNALQTPLGTGVGTSLTRTIGTVVTG